MNKSYMISTAVRNMKWDSKVQLATDLGFWDKLMEEAIEHLEYVTPEGYGYGSSDRNHVTMGMVESELIHRLSGSNVENPDIQ